MLTRSRKRNPEPIKLSQKRKKQTPEETLPEEPKQTPEEKTLPEPKQTPPEEAESSNDTSKTDELREQLNNLYKNVAAAPSYSAKITEFLRQHDTHGVYRRITKKKFPRRKVIARFPFDICMADLIEYPQYKHANNGYCFILIMIDCFTKMVYAAPMKKKNKEWTSDAFESIFKNFVDYPINLVTDGGLEFFNSSVRKVFDTYGINHYKTPTRTKWKASMAERAIRTLKSRIEKYLTMNKTKRWIDILNQFVENYNSVPHSTHGLPPRDVTDENRQMVYKRLYPNKDLTVVCKLKIGDRVRKLREKTQFEKGYTKNWSEEIYIIAEQRQSNTVCWYKLKELSGAAVPGIWYYYQLNLVARHDHQPERDNSKQ